MIYFVAVESEEEGYKFDMIYKKYRHLMFTIAENILHDKYTAEDVVHEAFIKISKNMSKLGDVDSRKTKNYIIILTKTTALDFYRKRSQSMEREVFVDDLENQSTLLSPDTVGMDEENKVLEIIKKMPEIYKEIFILKYVNEYSNSEIAEILGISEGTIRKRISRGKDIIAKAIEEKGKK